MFNKISLIISILLLISCAALFAEPPLDYEPSNNSNPVKYPDLQKYINANYLLMFVNNHGMLGYDQTQHFGKTDGLYYPSAMHPSYPGENTVVYSSGLWLGGKVNGEIRMAIAEYSSEFVTGPMESSTFLPDNPLFRVFKIDQASGPGDPDWDEWPADQGAPVDEFGDPLLSGDQTLWSVFNDADPALHWEMDTDPLGVEVQKTVWASNDPGEEIVLYVKYLLYNKGENYIDSFYFSFWADPDLGNASDDLVGCDTISNIFFCYNEADDSDYGANPPAWGGKLLSGPVVPSPGDVAIFNGQPLPDYRNLPMTAFAKYINGVDPQNAEQAYLFMTGLRKNPGTGGMEPAVDPDGDTTNFVLAGDPVTGIGWIDDSSADKRLMMTTGPINFYPGDSQQVVIKFAVDQGSDAVHAVPRLRGTLDSMAVNVSIKPHNGRAVIVPDTMHVFYANYMGPDTMLATIYFGDFEDDYPASNVLQNSFTINSKVFPYDIWITSHPDFTNDVIACTFRVAEFVASYGPIWGTTDQQFSVSGRFSNHHTFYCDGSFIMHGHRIGDVNTDGQLDISDAVYLISYIFDNGNSPEPLLIADCDCNNSVNISDIVYLIRYLFGNGPIPCGIN